ncbi:MAG: hypothetical protein IPG47_10215 [Thermoflexaceae bacterium]|nr:hypothetical protein [Thermoflexaceae bacterium]
MNKELAEKIDAKPGDEVSIFCEGKPITLVVKVISPNEVLTGAFNSFAKQGGGVAVSATTQPPSPARAKTRTASWSPAPAGVKCGPLTPDVVVDKDRAGVRRPPLPRCSRSRRMPCGSPSSSATPSTTIFVVFGLFSIAAGVLHDLPDLRDARRR